MIARDWETGDLVEVNPAPGEAKIRTVAGQHYLMPVEWQRQMEAEWAANREKQAVDEAAQAKAKAERKALVDKVAAGTSTREEERALLLMVVKGERP